MPICLKLLLGSLGKAALDNRIFNGPAVLLLRSSKAVSQILQLVTEIHLFLFKELFLTFYNC
jgi:hypothetical protein